MSRQDSSCKSHLLPRCSKSSIFFNNCSMIIWSTSSISVAARISTRRLLKTRGGSNTNVGSVAWRKVTCRATAIFCTCFLSNSIAIVDFKLIMSFYKISIIFSGVWSTFSRLTTNWSVVCSSVCESLSKIFYSCCFGTPHPIWFVLHLLPVARKSQFLSWYSGFFL